MVFLIMKKVTGKFRNRAVAGAFESWSCVYFAERAWRSQLEKANKAMAKLTNRMAADAYEAWLEFASTRKRKGHLMRKVTGKFRNRVYAGAFEAWIDFATTRKTNRQKLVKVS